MEAFADELRELIRARQVVVVVGAGVSMGASGSALASWTGLLQNGIERCKRIVPNLRPEWIAAAQAEISSPEIEDLLSAAERICVKLNAPDGPDFRSWLRDTVGSLRANDRRVLDAIRALECPLVTTNYDELLEIVTGLPPVPWADPTGAQAVLTGREEGIFHVHGFWRHPTTIILGNRSYQLLLDNEHSKAMLQALWATRSLLFIGCGGGLTDPNFSRLLGWARKLFSKSIIRHYRLAKHDEVRSLQATHPAEERIAVISYGASHADLAPFLLSLLPSPNLLVTAANGASATTSNSYSVPTAPAVSTEELREELHAAQQAFIKSQAMLRDQEQRASLAEESARLEAAQRRELADLLSSLPVRAAGLALDEVGALLERAAVLSNDIQLDEASIRRLIDEGLRQAGWDADSNSISHANGARPARGRNMAIANWPIQGQVADYVLFADEQPLAIVEAKSRHRLLPAALDAARGLTEASKVPILFAANGRRYARESLQRGGVWMLDTRTPTSVPRALNDWYTPQGLVTLLSQDELVANAALAALSFDELQVRPHQKRAIESVERALADGRRACLISMAPGAGKSLTCAALAFRLLESRRFRRILYIVDRVNLGEQFMKLLDHVELLPGVRFTSRYTTRGPKGRDFRERTQLQVATIQSLGMWLRDATKSESVPHVDYFDCIIVDECHRGYEPSASRRDQPSQLLDEGVDLTQARVLEHFDAVRIGVTSSPVLRESKTFGPPVFWYDMSDAVVDGFTVSPEQPVRLAELFFDARRVIDHAELGAEAAGKSLPRVATAYLPNEVTLDFEKFDRALSSAAFNDAACREIAAHIDPRKPGKTLIFCANDHHADHVTELLARYWYQQYGVAANAVAKITATVLDANALVDSFRRLAEPAAAVTVDMLISGVIIPEVVNLVFMRPVKSRQMFIQMLSRGSFMSPGKRSYRVFDAVGVCDYFRDIFEGYATKIR